MRSPTPLIPSNTETLLDFGTMDLDGLDLYKIDLDGDVILYTPEYLPDALTKKQHPDANEDTHGEVSHDEDTQDDDGSRDPAEENQTSNDIPESPVCFLVSSKHLKMASPYFNNMFKDHWAEGKALATSQTANVKIPINGCKPEILPIVLDARHGKFRKLPKRLQLEELVDVSVITDIFQCHEVIEKFALEWIKLLWPRRPKEKLGRARWIAIAAVFGFNDILLDITGSAMRNGEGPFDGQQLPIPAYIKNRIDEERENYLKHVLDSIQDQISLLMTGETLCDRECDAKYLGLIIMALAGCPAYLQLQTTFSNPSRTIISSVPLEGLNPYALSETITHFMPSNHCPRESADHKSTRKSPPKFPCLNREYPFGFRAHNLAGDIYKILKGVVMPQ